MTKLGSSLARIGLGGVPVNRLAERGLGKETIEAFREGPENQVASCSGKEGQGNAKARTRA
jgi:hypothetical protein